MLAEINTYHTVNYADPLLRTRTDEVECLAEPRVFTKSLEPLTAQATRAKFFTTKTLVD
jgi:hypothetical protein